MHGSELSLFWSVCFWCQKFVTFSTVLCVNRIPLYFLWSTPDINRHRNCLKGLTPFSSPLGDLRLYLFVSLLSSSCSIYPWLLFSSSFFYFRVSLFGTYGCLFKSNSRRLEFVSRLVTNHVLTLFFFYKFRSLFHWFFFMTLSIDLRCILNSITGKSVWAIFRSFQYLTFYLVSLLLNLCHDVLVIPILFNTRTEWIV